MRYNNRGFQNQARKVAENLGQCDGDHFDQRAREVRAENARRVAAAQAAQAARRAAQ